MSTVEQQPIPQAEQQFSITQVDQILSENAQFLQEWSEMISIAG